MKYTKLGNTGVEVSQLGFGAMRLPMVTIGGEDYVHMDKAVEVLHAAFRQGVTYVDTAPGYCNRESVLAVGLALRSWKGSKITVATKASGGFVKGKGDLRKTLERQLSILGRDYLDFYLFHGIGWAKFDKMEQESGWIAEMQQAKAEGLVKHIGFSFHDEPENMIKLVDTGLFELVQCQYNYLDRRNEAAIAHAASKGLATIIMGPVGGGRLSVIPKNMREHGALSQNRAAELALRFVISNPNVNVALSGMGDLAMVEENVAAIDKGPLNADEIATLDELLEENKKLSNLYCTGCGYCMPCPNGVNIPRNFELYNYEKVYGFEEYARNGYAGLLKREADASKCIECGTCEPLCPQHIPIIDQLKEVAELFG